MSSSWRWAALASHDGGHLLLPLEASDVEHDSPRCLQAERAAREEANPPVKNGPVDAVRDQRDAALGRAEPRELLDHGAADAHGEPRRTRAARPGGSGRAPNPWMALLRERREARRDTRAIIEARRSHGDERHVVHGFPALALPEKQGLRGGYSLPNAGAKNFSAHGKVAASTEERAVVGDGARAGRGAHFGRVVESLGWNDDVPARERRSPARGLVNVLRAFQTGWACYHAAPAAPVLVSADMGI